jgi:hypothetical protein
MKDIGTCIVFLNVAQERGATFEKKPLSYAFTTPLNAHLTHKIIVLYDFCVFRRHLLRLQVALRQNLKRTILGEITKLIYIMLQHSCVQWQRIGCLIRDEYGIHFLKI